MTMQANGKDSQGDPGSEPPRSALREAAVQYAHHAITATEYDELLGGIIRQERIARGLTAEAAAERAELAYKTYLRVENGKKVRYLTWQHIENLFYLQPGTLLSARAKTKPAEEVERVLSSTRDREDSTSPQNLSRTALEPPVAYGLTPYGIAPREIPLREIPLRDRLTGLGLDDLRRLRDMVEGAIYTMQRSVIEEELAAAAAEVTVARRAAQHAQDAVNSIVSSFSRADTEARIRLAEWSAEQVSAGIKNAEIPPEIQELLAKVDELRTTLDEARMQTRFAADRYNTARAHYEMLRHSAEVGAEKAEQYRKEQEN
ncbi:hypothetical protein [Amycolatopsis sp. NPDC051128]|uniref:hypothetical protein n=1 Tax=Amycolatopsis sp. NPDC051128 TaxID=3155412 RepID=UPI003447F97A